MIICTRSVQKFYQSSNCITTFSPSLKLGFISFKDKITLIKVIVFAAIPTLGVKYQVVPSLRTAYDYLNKINLNVGRINLDLFPGDSFNIIGSFQD